MTKIKHLDPDVAEMAQYLRDLADRVDAGEVVGVAVVLQERDGEMDLELLGDNSDYGEWHVTLCVAAEHFLELQRDMLFPEDVDDDV